MTASSKTCCYRIGVAAVMMIGAFIAHAVEVRIPDIAGEPGKTLAVPILIDNAAGVTGFTIQIAYPSQLMTADSVVAGNLTQSWSNLQTNTSVPGLVTVSGLDLTPIGGTGSLLSLNVTLSNSATLGQSGEITLQESSLNDGALEHTVVNGSVVISAAGEVSFETGVTIAPGETGNVDLTIALPGNLNGFTLEVAYDTSVITSLDAHAAGLTASWSNNFVTNTSESGVLTVSALNTAPASGTGVLLQLAVTASSFAQNGETTDLVITDIALNDRDIPALPAIGSVTIEGEVVLNPPDLCTLGGALTTQLTTLQNALGVNGDLDNDGIADEFLIGLMEYSACTEGDSSLAMATNAAFTLNWMTLAQENGAAGFGEYIDVLALLISAHTPMQTALINTLANQNITLNGAYEIVACNGEACLPEFAKDFYYFYDNAAYPKGVNEPYAATSDLDGDGDNNLTEYQNVVMRGGNATDFAIAALDSNRDGDEVPLSIGDINTDDKIDSSDIQLVINGALSLPTAFDTDANNDGETNATDIQLVINGALGL